ncbi:MAG TPA: DMT family transporter [Phycisphaerales bacterium]|nr:DMT family transporter [Phycisphaerales bacterium]
MNAPASLVGFFLAAAAAGLLSTMQPGMNAKLGGAAGSPFYGGLVNFVIGIGLIVIVLLALRAMGSPLAPAPAVSKLSSVPWWSWFGGLLGATYVCTAIFVVPKIGGVNYIVCIVVGQVIGHLLIDQFGLVGLPKHPLTTTRFVGVVLVIIGMLLVTAGSKPKAALPANTTPAVTPPQTN